MFFSLQLKVRDRFKLEQILGVLVINKRLDIGVIALAGADVAVQDGVGKAQVVLVGLAAQAVRRGLFYQVYGQAQLLSYSFDFGYGQSAQGREIAGGIAVAG